VRFSREDKDKRFKSIFLWDMSFTSGELKELRITYTMPFSMAAGGTAETDGRAFPTQKHGISILKTLSLNGLVMFTETGKSWRGRN